MNVPSITFPRASNSHMEIMMMEEEEERKDKEKRKKKCMHAWMSEVEPSTFSFARRKKCFWKSKEGPYLTCFSLAWNLGTLKKKKKKYSQLPPYRFASRPSCRLEAESEYAQSGQLVSWVPSWPLTPAGPPHPLAVLFPLPPSSLSVWITVWPFSFSKETCSGIQPAAATFCSFVSSPCCPCC